MSVGYDEVVLRLTEPDTGRRRAVHCEGHIGHELVGFWDEVIVESAHLSQTDPFLNRCLGSLAARYPSGPPETGQEARNDRSFSVLVVTLADGAELRVAASRFSVR